MGPPERYDPPVIYRGCFWPPIVMVWKDQLGQPVDLTGWTPFAKTINGVDLKALLADPVNGTITLGGIPKETTAGFRIGNFSWDFIWQDVNGIRYPPILKGIIPIKQPSTHEFTASK